VVDTGLPPDWEPRWSRTYKRAYIWNNPEHYSIWIGDKEPLPEGTDKEQLYLYLNQEIEASHLLIKHNQSRNKSSWREVSLLLDIEQLLSNIYSRNI
jgi:NIMA-interacting peptidyl-prolyl cis-trans isomerase 1